MAAGAETAPDLQSSVKPARTRTSRTTRSQLWDPPEEDLPLLDSPLEVDSEIPVADALIKRLQDEEKEGTELIFISSLHLRYLTDDRSRRNLAVFKVHWVNFDLT